MIGDLPTAPDGRQATLTDFIGLSADGTFANNSKATYTYGTAIAHVAVDAKTGHVEVIDYVVVDDVGRIINAMTLHGQVVGAAVQGLGGVFSEEIAYDANGQLRVTLEAILHLGRSYVERSRASAARAPGSARRLPGRRRHR